MRSRRTKQQRRGRYLPPVDVLPFIQDNEDLRATHERLLEQGYALRQFQRFYLARSGILTVRIVWRRRRDGSSCTHEIIQRFDVSDIVARRGTPAIGAHANG